MRERANRPDPADRHGSAARRRRAGIAVVTACAVLSAASCTLAPPSETLRVLASPELANLAPVLEDLERDTGIRIELDTQDTVDGTGRLAETDHDAAWLSSDAYFRLTEDAWPTDRPRPLSTPIMQSPVAIGVRPGAIDGLRATSADPSSPSWADVAAAAAAGHLTYALADPERSYSGLSALVGVATAAAGTGTALRPQDVACNRLAGFFQGEALTAPDPVRLADRFRARPDVDALVGYESELLTLNRELDEPLEIVYPRDGMVLATYPLLLLDPARRDQYDEAVDWLTSAEAQRAIMTATLRRPVNPEVEHVPELRADIGNALYFPGDAEVLDQLLAAHGADRTPGRTIFVLDFSGSMRGRGIADLRTTFGGLGGEDGSSLGRFVRFYRGETLTVVRFGGTATTQEDFVIDDEQDIEQVRQFVGSGRFGDRTAMWSALETAYRTAAPDVAAGRAVSIVLMTDGRNNAGISASTFVDRYRSFEPALQDVPTYTIRYGPADPHDLRHVAEATGGRMVRADAGALRQAFQEIRGCGGGDDE